MAELDIPANVMSELKDIFIEINNLKNISQLKYHQRVNIHAHAYTQEPLKKNLTKEEYSDILKRVLDDEEKYYESDSYKAHIKNLHEVYKKGRDLLEPYIDFSLTPPPKPEFKGLTEAEQIEYVLNYYKDDYGVSDSDIEQLRDIMKEQRAVGKDLSKLRRKSNSPEFKQLQEKSRDVGQRQRLVLRDYEKAHKKKRRAKQTIVRELTPPRPRRTAQDKLEEKYQRAIKKYTRHDITISAADEKAYKAILAEVEEMNEEIGKMRMAGRSAVKENSIEAHNIKARYEELETRGRALMEPYEGQLKAAKKKR